jgi:hypothetical protein
LHALLFWQGHHAETQPDPGLIDSKLVQTKLLPAETLPLLARLRDNQLAREAYAGQLLAPCNGFLSRASSLLESDRGT